MPLYIIYALKIFDVVVCCSERNTYYVSKMHIVKNLTRRKGRKFRILVQIKINFKQFVHSFPQTNNKKICKILE